MDFRKTIKENFKISNSFSIQTILPNIDRSKQRPIFEVLENQIICAGFKDSKNRINLVLINPDFTIEYTWRSEQPCLNGIGFLTSGKTIVLWNCEESKSSLTVFNLKLKVIMKKLINVAHLKKKKLASNKSIICLLADDEIKIFSWDLKYIKSVGQSSFPNGLFYILDETKINGCFLNGEKLYVLYSNRIDILNIDTGKKLESISINVDKMRLDSNGNLMIWSKVDNKISRLNTKGLVIDEFFVETDMIDFVVVDTGPILLFN